MHSTRQAQHTMARHAQHTIVRHAQHTIARHAQHTIARHAQRCELDRSKGDTNSAALASQRRVKVRKPTDLGGVLARVEALNPLDEGCIARGAEAVLLGGKQLWRPRKHRV